VISEILFRLTSDWSDVVALAGVQLTQPLAVLGLSNPDDEIGKTIIFVHSSGEAQPSLVVKIARTEKYQESVKHEHEALTHLSLIPFVNKSIPLPVGLFSVGSETVAVETVISGSKLSVLLNRWKRNRASQVRKDIRRTSDWLVAFKDGTLNGRQIFNGRNSIESRLGLLEPHLAEIGVHSFKVTDILTLADDYQGLELPLAGEHGDLWPSNYFIDNNQVGIIDWENFAYAKHPLYDFFFFLTTYAFAYPWSKWHKASPLQSFRKIFLKGNWYSELVLDAITRYFDVYAIPIEASACFFAQFIIEAAIRYSDRNVGRDNVWLFVLQAFVENLRNSVFFTMADR